MTAGYHVRSAISASDPLEEQVVLRDFNNRRLAQAINYLAAEGGDDSPAAYIDRVDRINRVLLQQISQAGQDFDLRLYRCARALVREVQCDFEDAAKEEPFTIEESDGDLPENYTPPKAEYALYDNSEAKNPLPMPSEAPLRQRQGDLDNDAQKERHLKDGGPSSDSENRYKDFPAILPFPDTLPTTHGESLQINFDRTHSPKKDNANSVETNLPFDNSQLKQYRKLLLYGSGSRFKLPLPTSEEDEDDNDDDERIDAFGIEHNLKKAGGAFKEEDRDNEVIRDYAHRSLSDKFVVDKQCKPSTGDRKMQC